MSTDVASPMHYTVSTNDQSTTSTSAESVPSFAPASWVGHLEDRTVCHTVTDLLNFFADKPLLNKYRAYLRRWHNRISRGRSFHGCPGGSPGHISVL